MSLASVEERLAAAHRRLEKHGVLELELERAVELVAEPGVEPLGRAGPYESGAARLAGMLESARRLPDALTVRALLPAHSDDAPGDPPDDAAIEAGFRDYCRFRAEAAWREAQTVRQTGRRQLPRALAFACLPGGVAALFDYLSTTVGGAGAQTVFLALAGIGLISVWVVIWMPVEELLFDWRPAARTAAVYDLLAGARLELVRRGRGRRAAPSAPGRTPAWRPGVGRAGVAAR